MQVRMSEGSNGSGLPAQFGRFLLLERIAVGGMAEVFRAKITSSHGFEKLLVIKRILPHLAADAAFVSMFIDEANLTAQLTHQKIVQILDFGDVGGQFFIALELIDGFDVLQLLRVCAARRTRIPRHLAAFVIGEVLDALDYAHTARDDIENKPMNIVHRDVSPSNIFLSKRGEVKLGDFGIARAHRRESKTEAGTFKGKYGYMSPEQVTGKMLDARSDLFSVGVVLAEMLMGRRLFAAAADLEVLLMIRDLRLDRFDKFGADLPPALQEIVRRALRKDPSERYQTASEFRDAIADWLAETKVRVGPSDLRAFIGELFGSSPEEAARIVQQQQRSSSSNNKVQPDEGARTQVDPQVSLAMAAVVAPAPAEAAPLAPRSAVVATLVDDGPTESVNYQAPTVMGDGLVVAEIEARISASAPEFDAAYNNGAATVAVADAFRLAPRTGVVPDGIGQFVSAAPGRPPDSAGDISVITPMRLICDLAASGESGLLVLEANKTIKEIFLVLGTPESVNTNVPSERFGEYLVAKGVLSEEDLDVALRALPQFGGKLGDTLVALRFFRPLELFRLLSRQVRDRVIDLFTWTEGTFAFYRGVRNPTDSFPLGLDTFEILGAGVVNMPRERLDRRFASSLDLRPKKTSRGRLTPEAFRIGPTPREVLEMLDGSRSLQEWIKLFSDRGEALTFLRSLYLLIETDLVQLE
jgi:serine/threonine-protein kinase